MKKKILVVVPVIVVVLGIAGYLQEGSSFYSALLASLNLLKAEFEELPPNILIEIARWLGIVFFFGLIYAAVVAVIESGVNLVKATRDDAVAVHGDSVYSQALLNSLGKKGIKTNNKIAFKAPVQVIIFDDDNKAIEFYQKNAASLKKAREVHICLEMGFHPSVEVDNVYITNLSEIRAIDYWRSHFCREPEKIAVVGPGLLAETVFMWGLLTNIFDVDCKNEYCVFGNFRKFRSIHCNIEKVIHEFGNDSITFYDDDWYANTEVIRDADRVILCGETLRNVETALDMRAAGVKGDIHIFAENNNITPFVDDNITVAGVLSRGNIRDIVLMDSIHYAGKLAHATYMLLEEVSAETVIADTVENYINTDAFRESWKSLDNFTRCSNYAASIHDPVKQMLLLDSGLDITGMTAEENKKQYDSLSDDIKDRLQETEHIRWSRYHLLNNWEKPEGEIVINGVKKEKDPVNKLHSDLVPYKDLSLKDKEKDAYFYQTLALRIK